VITSSASTNVRSPIFLTADWWRLAMLNYRVAPSVAAPFVPAGTDLDLWQGHAYISLIGFLFRDARIRGVAIPFHRSFEEVNLRVCVKREVDGVTRRAATFIRELVPRAAVAAVAHWTYNEPYRALPMRHRVEQSAEADGHTRVEYAWKGSSAWARMVVSVEGTPSVPVPGSEPEFITQRFWGYTRQRDGSTFEYEVEHPVWKVRPAADVQREGDLAALFPHPFARILADPPQSALLAEGSRVAIHSPVRLPR